MSDLYLKLVNTPVGKTAAQSLGLPSPAPLKRLKRVDQPFIEGDVLIGAGNVSLYLAQMAQMLDYHVIVCDPREEMIEQCDVISLHVHVTDETKYMINKKLFGLAKKDLYIINTSRGEIVNENDIVEALNTGKLTGYGADVIEDEFSNITKSPIIKAMNEGKNIIVTPHIGGMTIEGQTKAYKWSIDKL